MPDREKIIDELFAQAVGLSPAERETFLAACESEDGANAGVVDEVKALLTNYRRADEKNFLDKPFVSDASQTLRDGQEFEGYRIVRLIAEGGMGEVYLAEDDELKRKVAIKLNKGHATKDILRRFQNERQILANLQHPNIAQLYEAGATADGLPFFAMEYVEGKPIDKFVGDNKLSLDNRLKLFRTVCSAVSYAHQNLVIHRDIKPGNVFANKAGEVKLLDFGIAKLLQESEAGQVDATATLFRAMTPQYASPEQVKGEPITTASDVYSLGVLLYELLTGQRPYKLKSRTTEEITKAICEQEPTKPSSIVGSQESGGQGHQRLGSSPTVREGSVSAISSTINPKLLRGDLDNIMLKALRKEPERRYVSVEQFSEDIRRHLEGLPVSARKGTFSYRSSKFVKRNKIGVAAGAIISLTLLGGIIGTTHQALVARRERERAERRFTDVRKLADSYLFEFHESIKDLPGSLTARQLVINRGLQYLDSLSQEAGDDLSLHSELALAYQKIGAISFDTRQILETRHKAMSLNEKLVKAAPQNETYRRQLSDSYDQMSDAMKITGNTAQVLDYAKKSLQVVESLPATYFEQSDHQTLLADRYITVGLAQGEAGQFLDAIATYRRAVELQLKIVAAKPGDKEAIRDLGLTYGYLSKTLEKNGEYAEALEVGRKDTQIMDDLLASSPSSARYRRDVWANRMRDGRLLARTGDRRAAETNLTTSLDLIQRLSEEDPEDKGHRFWLAVTHFTLGDCLAGGDRSQDALRHYSQSVAIMEQLLSADSGWLEAQRYLAEMYTRFGDLLSKTHQTVSARAYLMKAIDLAERAVNADPQNAQGRRAQAEACVAAASFTSAEAIAQYDFNALGAARSLYEKSLAIYQDMKSKGTLSRADANKPDELAKEIAKCEAAMRK